MEPITAYSSAVTYEQVPQCRLTEGAFSESHLYYITGSLLWQITIIAHQDGANIYFIYSWIVFQKKKTQT